MDVERHDEVVAFLSNPASYGADVTDVEVIATHASIVFLAGPRAYKLKRPVHYPYLDYSTRGLRRRACEAELALNRRTAPELYLDVAAIRCGDDGRLSFGRGTPVDWVVVMRRFDERDLLDRVAAENRLTPDLARDIADRVAAFHDRAERSRDLGGRRAMKSIIEGNERNLREASSVFAGTKIDELTVRSNGELDAVADLLDHRRDAALVRRCHGDLHLKNICLFEGRPLLFDCIEFSDELAWIDVLYDLAFLVMDLDGRGLRATANLILNRYLDMANSEDGMAALPLFLSLRAAIRAHVTSTAATLEVDAVKRRELETAAKLYLDRALGYLTKPQPRLVAIGGLSGTGKSTLAAALAPELGAAPGARVLRSDVIRKRILGRTPETPLPADAYAATVNEQVYEVMRAMAKEMLRCGYAVIVDAVSARPRERDAFEAIADEAGVRFTGFWLEAPAATLERRVAVRRGDASDATPALVRRQLEYELGTMEWQRIDASGEPAACLASARAVLAETSGPTA
jgi:hypothetical protein